MIDAAPVARWYHHVQRTDLVQDVSVPHARGEGWTTSVHLPLGPRYRYHSPVPHRGQGKSIETVSREMAMPWCSVLCYTVRLSAHTHRPLRGKKTIDVPWSRQSGGGGCNGVTPHVCFTPHVYVT